MNLSPEGVALVQASIDTVIDVFLFANGEQWPKSTSFDFEERFRKAAQRRLAAAVFMASQDVFQGVHS